MIASNEKITTRPERGKMCFFSKMLILKEVQLFDARRPEPDSGISTTYKNKHPPSLNIHVVIT